MKILIADDHALFLDGLANVLQQVADKVEVIQTGQSQQVLALVEQHPDLDLVLLDLKMPGMDGISLLQVICRNNPLIPVVMLSASEDRLDMQRALDNGAMGYIPKSASASVILSALQLILSGGRYIPPEMMTLPDVIDSTGPSMAISSLTPRQHEVLKFIIEGISNKQIAARLGCTEGTVKVHVTAVLKALGVDNRTQAAVAAQQLGLAFS